MTLLLDKTIESRSVEFIREILQHNIQVKDIDQHKCVKLPALRLNDSTMSAGLSCVTRNLVKLAAQCETQLEEKQRKIQLLGYKQNCLKACAAVSGWTKFCECEFPTATKTLIKNIRINNYVLPMAYLRMEKELSVKKKIPKSMEYLQGKKRREKVENNINIDIKDESLKALFASIKLEDEVVNHKESCWPYLCGFQITLVDLLIFSFLSEALSEVCWCTVQNFFSLLPHVGRWFLRCSTYNNISQGRISSWRPCSKVCTRPPWSPEGNVSFVNHVSHIEKKTNAKQMHQKISRNLPAIYDTLLKDSIQPEFNKPLCQTPILWHNFPESLDPAQGELNKVRAQRKRQQIENMYTCIRSVITPGCSLVDFCSGGGHLAIVVAYLHQDCHVTLVENKDESLDRGILRVGALGLSNVSFVQSNLEYYRGKFDIGVSLHACGSATDLVLEMCIKNRASFVVCPCCYGSIRPTANIVYPKSLLSCLSEEQYFLLARSADQTNTDFDSEYSKQGKRAMLCLDYDRARDAENRALGCKVNIYSMQPASCSPKNNLLVGRYDVIL